MYKRISIFLTICLFFIQASYLLYAGQPLYQENQQMEVIVNKHNAKLMLKPSADSLVLMNLPLGATFEVIEALGEWVKVNLLPDKDGIIVSGYINISYLEIRGSRSTPIKSAIQQPVVQPIESKETPEKEWPLGIGIGLSGGYANPSNQLYSGGIAFGINFSIDIMKYLAIEISGQYFGPNVESSEEGLSKGLLSIIPIQLSLQGRYPLSEGQIIPYLELGGGYYLNNFTINSNLTGGWEQIGFALEEKVESAFGFHFGAGLDYYVMQNLSLGLGFKYCLTKMKGSWSLTDNLSSIAVSGELADLELNPVIIGLRIKYLFK